MTSALRGGEVNGRPNAHNNAHRLLEGDSGKAEVKTFPKLLDLIYGRSQLKIIFPPLYAAGQLGLMAFEVDLIPQ